MKKQLAMGNRGSVTVFLAVLMPVILFIGLLVYDLSEYKYSLNNFYRENYLIIDSELGKYDSELFNRYGILGVEKLNSEITYSDSLEDSDILMLNIIEIMKYREVNDIFMGQIDEYVESYYANNILSIFKNLDRITDLVRKINVEINAGIVPSAGDLIILTELLSNYWMYFDTPHGSYEELINLNFKDGEIIEIKIKDEFRNIRVQYFDILSGYTDSFVLEKFLLSEYIIDYFGYSSNASKKEIYSSEYIHSGIDNVKMQRIVVEGEIFSIRMIFNIISLSLDKKRIEMYVINSGGDVRVQMFLMLIDAVNMSMRDLVLIYTGSYVPLIKSPEEIDKIHYRNGLYYKDYIRILLLLSTKEMLLERIKTVIENDLGIPFERICTSIAINREFKYKFRYYNKKYILRELFEGGFIER